MSGTENQAMNEKTNTQKLNIVRFKPPMDFLRAKLALGMKASLTYNEMTMEDVQKSFITKSMQVSYFEVTNKMTLDYLMVGGSL